MQAFINHTVKKISLLPPWKGLEIQGQCGSGGRGGWWWRGAASSKGKYEANNFHGVGGTVEKINSLEGVVIIECSTK